MNIEKERRSEGLSGVYRQSLSTPCKKITAERLTTVPVAKQRSK